MGRRIRNVTTAFSTAVLAAVIILWGLSYFRVVGLSNALFHGSQVRGESGIWSTGGRILFDTERHVDVSRVPNWRGCTFSNEPYASQPQWVDQPTVTRWHAAGFRVSQSYSATGDGTVAEWAAVTVPYWALASAASLVPVLVWGRALVRRRRGGLGRCQRCGYDLRATPGRCPECGSLAADSSPAAR